MMLGHCIVNLSCYLCRIVSVCVP